MNLKNCEHKITYQMYWPDGGTSEVCKNCLLTRYHSEFHTTEWQDHEYKSLGDWYREAAKVQNGIDKTLADFHRKNKVKEI